MGTSKKMVEEITRRVMNKLQESTISGVHPLDDELIAKCKHIMQPASIKIAHETPTTHDRIYIEFAKSSVADSMTFYNNNGWAVDGIKFWDNYFKGPINARGVKRAALEFSEFFKRIQEFLEYAGE